MDLLDKVLIEPFEQFSDKALGFLSNFLEALLILLVGAIVGKALQWLLLRAFRAIGVDRFSERSGAMALLKKGGIGDPLSALLSKAAALVAFTAFAIVAAMSLEIPAVEKLFDKFLLYLPNIFVGVLVVILGHIVANFLGRAALIAAVNAGWKAAGAIGGLVRTAIFILAVTMALEQLGIGSGTIQIAFAITFGGTVLALAIAFGLGGRDIAREYLEKTLKGREEKKDGIEHL